MGSRREYTVAELEVSEVSQRPTGIQRFCSNSCL
jgi:hypothetical protein